MCGTDIFPTSVGESVRSICVWNSSCGHFLCFCLARCEGIGDSVGTSVRYEKQKRFSIELKSIIRSGGESFCVSVASGFGIKLIHARARPENGSRDPCSFTSPSACLNELQFLSCVEIPVHACRIPSSRCSRCSGITMTTMRSPCKQTSSAIASNLNTPPAPLKAASSKSNTPKKPSSKVQSWWA